MVSRLAIVACHFNPCGYSRPVENFRRFQVALGNVPLFTVEASFTGRFMLDATWQVHATERNLMWQKEALLDWAIRQVPAEFDCIAWVDADVLFMNPDWMNATLLQLAEFPVVQLYESIGYLNENHELVENFNSLLKKRQKGLDGHGQPGAAWAARRTFLDRHGLYAHNIVGAGDVLWCYALFGDRNGYLTERSTPAMNSHYRRWGQRVWKDVRAQVGCVPGALVHLYHGTLKNRHYNERNQYLLDANFNPAVDVRHNETGLLEWTSNKPQLHQQLAQYFAVRREDDVA